MTLGLILKKTISTFLMPLPLGVLFAGLALFFLYKRKFIKTKVLLFISLLWIFIFSYEPIADRMLYQIETTYPALHQAPKETQYIYLLGGGHNDDESLPLTSQVLGEGVVRLSEAIRLYHQLDGKVMLIVSGYKGPNAHTSHAQMQNRLAQALGIDKEHIIVSPQPEDTEEEAMKAKEIIGDKPFIVVTSAYHMKRAMKWFEKQGLHPTPAPTYHQALKNNTHYTKIFSPLALIKSRVVFHEILGMLWQKVKNL